VSFHANVALGRTWGNVFNVYVILCVAKTDSEKKALLGDIVEEIGGAPDVVAEFRGSECIEMGEGMWAYVRSMDVCVDKLAECVDPMRVVMQD
jgi:hypothetical protein